MRYFQFIYSLLFYLFACAVCVVAQENTLFKQQTNTEEGGAITHYSIQRIDKKPHITVAVISICSVFERSNPKTNDATHFQHSGDVGTGSIAALGGCYRSPTQ